MELGMTLLTSKAAQLRGIPVPAGIEFLAHLSGERCVSPFALNFTSLVTLLLFMREMRPQLLGVEGAPGEEVRGLRALLERGHAALH